jgi:hypothetical protein
VSVTAACDDLKEELNLIRLESLTAEADEKVAILERAMQNVNHGQGIGAPTAAPIRYYGACMYVEAPRRLLERRSESYLAVQGSRSTTL